MMPRHESRRSHPRDGRHQAGNGHAWAGATDLQSILQIEVGDRIFHLHKFPLLSKSGRLNRLVFESRDTEKDRILLPDIPGGAEAFEMAARFLYGGSAELTSSNVASLRCAAEYLEMTDSVGDGNLVEKTENYLNAVVLGSWKDSITVLKTCSDLKPWAEELEIVRRCSESVAWKASTDPHGIRWSFSTKAGARDTPRDWWFHDVSSLCIDTFSKVINAVNVKGMKYTMVAAAVGYYAEKWLGLTKESSTSTTQSNKGEESESSCIMAFTGFNQDIVAKDAKTAQHKNRAILQGIVSLLPTQPDSMSCKFLLKLLRVACMVNAGPLCKTDLAKRIGAQLDKVSLEDLLIPAYVGSTSDSTYDIDVVQQVVEYYLQEQSSGASPPFSPSTGSVTSESSIDSDTTLSSSSLSIRSASSVSSSDMSGSSVTSRGSVSGRSISGSSSSSTGRSSSISVSDSSSVTGRSTTTVTTLSGSSVNGSSVSGSSTTGSSGSHGSRSSFSSLSTSSETSDSSTSSSSSSRSDHSRSGSSVTSTSDSESDDDEMTSVKLEKKFYVNSDQGPTRKPQLPATTPNLKVAQLLQTYLEEVAKDSNVALVKFVALADLFSEFPRDSDDCIYRAIDAFLRAHPSLTEHNRQKLCRVMDTQALSLDACMHAASNERLPLRVVVQVLFSEHVKLRNAITGSAVTHDKDLRHSRSLTSASFSSTSTTSSSRTSSSSSTDLLSSSDGTKTVANSMSSARPAVSLSSASHSIASVVSSLLPGGLSLKETLRVAVSEIDMLRKAVDEIELLRKTVQEIEVVKSRLSLMDTLQQEMQNMALKFQDLAHDYTGMTQQVEELTKASKQKSGWSSGWKKMAKPFQSKVDQHEKEQIPQHKADWDLHKDYNTHRKSTEPPPLYQMQITHAAESVLPAINQPTKALEPPVTKVVVNPLLLEPVKDVIPKVQPSKKTPKLALEAPCKDLQRVKESSLAAAAAKAASKDGPAAESTHIEHLSKDHHHRDHPVAHKTPDHHRHIQHQRSHHYRATTPDVYPPRHHKDPDTVSISSTSSFVSTSSTHSNPRHKDRRHRVDSSSGHRHAGRDSSEDLHYRSSSGHGIRRDDSKDRNHPRHHHSSQHRDHSSGHEHQYRDGSVEDRHHRSHGRSPEHYGHQRKDHRHADSHHPHQNSKEPKSSTTSNHSGHHHKLGGAAEHHEASHHKERQKDGSEHHSSSHHSLHDKDRNFDSHPRYHSSSSSKEPHASSTASNHSGHRFHKDLSSKNHAIHLHHSKVDGLEHDHSSQLRQHKDQYKDVIQDTNSNASSEPERPKHRRHPLT